LALCRWPRPTLNGSTLAVLHSKKIFRGEETAYITPSKNNTVVGEEEKNPCFESLLRIDVD
jgi:hypothetical protein